MKKILSLLLVAAMVFCMTAVSFADETPTFSIDQANEDLYEGAWVAIADVFAMYLPADWDVYEIDDEDAEEGLLFDIMPEDEEVELVVYYYTPEEIEVSDISEVAEIWSEEFEYNCTMATVNDIPVVLIECEEDDIGGIVLLTDTGYIFEIGFYGVSSETYSAYFANILCTLVADAESLEAIAADEAA